ncbi:hypothetical protein DRN58_03875 [Thermococci archaeon]|nr:MAG: hypothetical protein DRN58_03875 [Thermococci archaeon]
MKKKEYNKLAGIILVLGLIVLYGYWDKTKEMGTQTSICTYTVEGRAPNAHLSDLPQPIIRCINYSSNSMTWEIKIQNPDFPIGWIYPSTSFYGHTTLKMYEVRKLKISSDLILSFDDESKSYKTTFTTELFSGSKEYGTYMLSLMDSHCFFSAPVDCAGSCTISGYNICPYVKFRIPSSSACYGCSDDTSLPSWVGEPIILDSPYTPLQISNFQQTQVDLTQEKVIFNTNINAKAKYYLKIGGTWHLQSTESNYSTNHSYTFIVDEYTPTDYKIIVEDNNGMTTEKTGTIRTVGPEICGDGIDNDNDGLTDWDDTECVRVTITKKSENIGTTTYYGVFTITGDAEAYIEYQKGSGQVKKVNLTKVGQDYVLSLENLEPDSAYNGIIYAQDVNFPENNANIPLTFTTLKEGGIIEVTSEETTSDTFNCKFRINADTINSLTFSYKTPYGSINEVDPNDQGNNTYAVSITGLSAGDYEYIIETSTNKGDDSHEGTFTIEEIPPETSPPPTNTNAPTLSLPPSPSNSDYSMTVLIIVVILLVGALIYTNYYKKIKRKRRR